MRIAWPALLLFCTLAGGPAVAADEVTIYRCVAATGDLTLRDTPCAKGQRQETRSMLRPVDAPPSRTVRRIPMGQVPGGAPSPPPRTIVITTPRPMYECVTPDGTRYSSETPEGNPRWVPLWTLGYPVLPYPSGRNSSADLSITLGDVRIRGNQTVMTPPVYVPEAYYGAGTWVRDRCYALPQGEVCARLVDRRDEIRRRFFNAMPSERDVLNVEERGINARLANDCGNE